MGTLKVASKNLIRIECDCGEYFHELAPDADADNEAKVKLESFYRGKKKDEEKEKKEKSKKAAVGFFSEE